MTLLIALQGFENFAMRGAEMQLQQQQQQQHMNHCAAVIGRARVPEAAAPAPLP